MSTSNSSTTNNQHLDEERGAPLPSPEVLEDGSEVMMAPRLRRLSTDQTMDGDDNGPFVMEDMDIMVRFNGNHNEDEDEDDNYVKPERKMTDNTAVTAQSSFTDMSDDAEDCHCNNNQNKPAALLDSLYEEDDCDSDDVMVTPDSCGCRWFKRTMLFLVFFVIVAFATVMIGAAVEKSHYESKEGTNHYYQTPQVCGVHDALADTGITFDGVQETHDAGAQVAHCGDCGACSTARDMAIMSETADSLTSDSTRCAFKLFVGKSAVEKCMEERVGFTPACEDCWLDNISCSFRSCKFTCIKYKLFRQENNKEGDDGDDLNDCLKCDERSCGPAFIECSGANRRRMGIISDIGREVIDQCTAVDVDWMKLHPPPVATQPPSN